MLEAKKMKRKSAVHRRSKNEKTLTTTTREESIRACMLRLTALREEEHKIRIRLLLSQKALAAHQRCQQQPQQGNCQLQPPKAPLLLSARKVEGVVAERRHVSDLQQCAAIYENYVEALETRCRQCETENMRMVQSVERMRCEMDRQRSQLAADYRARAEGLEEQIGEIERLSETAAIMQEDLVGSFNGLLRDLGAASSSTTAVINTNAAPLIEREAWSGTEGKVTTLGDERMVRHLRQTSLTSRSSSPASSATPSLLTSSSTTFSLSSPTLVPSITRMTIDGTVKADSGDPLGVGLTEASSGGGKTTRRGGKRKKSKRRTRGGSAPSATSSHAAETNKTTTNAISGNIGSTREAQTSAQQRGNSKRQKGKRFALIPRNCSSRNETLTVLY